MALCGVFYIEFLLEEYRNRTNQNKFQKICVLIKLKIFKKMFTFFYTISCDNVN